MLKKFPNLEIETRKSPFLKNKIDPIPHYPGRLLGDTCTREQSPFLKESKNPSDWHNLQAMLHVVAGWNGSEGEFEMKVKRSLALVNKSCEFLKEECKILGSWWVEKNKGMARRHDGEWFLKEGKGFVFFSKEGRMACAFLHPRGSELLGSFLGCYVLFGTVRFSI